MWARRTAVGVAWLVLGCAGPPALTVQHPGPGPHAGQLTVGLTSAAPLRWVRVDGGEWTRFDPDVFLLDTPAWPDGPHVVEVEVRDWVSQPAATTFTVHSDNSAPVVQLSARSRTVEQGHTLPIAVRTDEPATVTAHFLDRDRTLHPIGEHTWRALVGVPIRTDAGPQPLVLAAEDALGNTSRHTVQVQVEAVEWPFTGKLPLSKKKARVDPPAMVTMRAERDAVYATLTPDPAWSGPMALPVLGADRTSPFGTFREYPDGKRSFHDAEDLSRKPGTPIGAAAAGTVALAHAQEVHGNAVLIDHGHKVVTLYSHLKRIDVTAGQRVETGDRIGTIGSTGRSTGPHLHWGIVVDEVAVDPMQWVEQTFDPGDFEPFDAL